jgi:hypothetical protein
MYRYWLRMYDGVHVKHIGVIYHFARECAASGEIRMLFCRSEDNVSLPSLTKALPRSLFEVGLVGLGMFRVLWVRLCLATNRGVLEIGCSIESGCGLFTENCMQGRCSHLCVGRRAFVADCSRKSIDSVECCCVMTCDVPMFEGARYCKL